MELPAAFTLEKKVLHARFLFGEQLNDSHLATKICHFFCEQIILSINIYIYNLCISFYIPSCHTIVIYRWGKRCHINILSFIFFFMLQNSSCLKCTVKWNGLSNWDFWTIKLCKNLLTSKTVALICYCSINLIMTEISNIHTGMRELKISLKENFEIFFHKSYTRSNLHCVLTAQIELNF